MRRLSSLRSIQQRAAGVGSTEGRQGSPRVRSDANRVVWFILTKMSMVPERPADGVSYVR